MIIKRTWIFFYFRL